MAFLFRNQKKITERSQINYLAHMLDESQQDITELREAGEGYRVVRVDYVGTDEDSTDENVSEWLASHGGFTIDDAWRALNVELQMLEDVPFELRIKSNDVLSQDSKKDSDIVAQAIQAEFELKIAVIDWNQIEFEDISPVENLESDDLSEDEFEDGEQQVEEDCTKKEYCNPIVLALFIGLLKNVLDEGNPGVDISVIPTGVLLQNSKFPSDFIVMLDKVISNADNSYSCKVNGGFPGCEENLGTMDVQLTRFPSTCDFDDLVCNAKKYAHCSGSCDWIKSVLGAAEEAVMDYQYAGGSMFDEEEEEVLAEAHKENIETKDIDRAAARIFHGKADNLRALNDANKALARFAVSEFLSDEYAVVGAGTAAEEYGQKAAQLLGLGDNWYEALKQRTSAWLTDSLKSQILQKAQAETGRELQNKATRQSAAQAERERQEQEAAAKREAWNNRGRYLYGWQFIAYSQLRFGHYSDNQYEASPGTTKAFWREIAAQLDRDDPDMTEYLRDYGGITGVEKAWYEWKEYSAAYRFYCIVDHKLTPEELRSLRGWIEGQASDGFGEGFEQRDIEVTTRSGKKAYVNCHMWLRELDFWDGVFFINKGTDLRTKPDSEPEWSRRHPAAMSASK